MLAKLIECLANITHVLDKDGSLRFHVVGLELWARIFFGGEAPAELGERLIALAQLMTRAG